MGFNSDQASVANQLPESLNIPSVEDQDLFDDRLEELLRKHAGVINTKTGGLLSLEEKINFNQVFTTGDPQTYRNIYRKCFDLVNLNNDMNIGGGATVNFAHGISPLADAINIYVSCVTTDPEYFTAVYPDIYLDATNINFTNPHASAVSSAIAICEYTKN